MQKMELIHYHGLLAEIRGYFEAQYDEDVDIPEYDSQDIGPTAIHVGKGQHEDAVFNLAESLADFEPADSPAVSTPIPADD